MEMIDNLDDPIGPTEEQLYSLMREFPPTRPTTELEKNQWIRLARRGSVRRAMFWWMERFGRKHNDR